jgi:hypothetical protein
MSLEHSPARDSGIDSLRMIPDKAMPGLLNISLATWERSKKAGDRPAVTQLSARRIGYYHERQDEKRSIGLGPEHDWSSHAADAFGYMAIAYEEPPVKSAAFRRPAPPRIGSHWSA